MSFKFIAAALTAVALSATAAQAASPVQFPIAAQNGSGEHGTATLLQGTNGGVIVKLRLSGAPTDTPQPAHVHVGKSCATIDAKPKYPLTAVVNGMSESKIPNVTMAELQNGNFAINIHKSAKADEIGTYVACGEIPKAAAAK